MQLERATPARLPPWIRIRLAADGRYAAVQDALAAAGLHTVCESARCPNRSECFSNGTATFMILGDICTRHCRFCAVQGGQPLALDEGEPQRVAAMAARLGLRHVVITSVTRDDLPDGGAAAFAATIRQLQELGRLSARSITTEVLTPDFQGQAHSLKLVLEAAPDVFNHNLETVERLQPQIRPQANYRRSLQVLQQARSFQPRPAIKSGLMLGLGERDAELYQALEDLLQAGCEILTLGQYLAPTRGHIPVERFVSPDQFAHYRARALAMGFRAVAAGALVRSSYQAETLFRQATAKQQI